MTHIFWDDERGQTLRRERENYSPGGLVTWDVGAGVPDIGIVVDQKDRSNGPAPVGRGVRAHFSFGPPRSY